MIVAMNPTMHVETPFRGRLFSVEVLAQTNRNGEKLHREVVRHPGAVLIVPALDARRVVMIQNHRVAVGESLWEFPAGKLEPAEEPEPAAHRELLEETGYRAARMSKLGEFYTSPGFTDELMRVFFAENLTFAGQRLEPDENIQVEIVGIDEALEMVHDGRIRDGKTIAGLLMWRISSDARRQVQECRA
jgi:ADP-ribose pyrophosphatase